MNLNEFKNSTGLLRKKELDKVLYLAFYYNIYDNMAEFTLSDIENWFFDLNLNKPNRSRLLKNIKSSKNFTFGSNKDNFKVFGRTLDKLKKEIITDDNRIKDIPIVETILPIDVFMNTRGYIESLAKQINASYEFKIFDGCAVVMRRLLEILLILTYEHYSITDEIQDENLNFINLSQIINNAKQNATINLSGETRKVIDKFRKLGNFSAHRIEYVCRQHDIDNVANAYRVAIEELLFKSNLKQ